MRLGSELVPTAGSWVRSKNGARFTLRFAAVPGTGFVVVGRDHALASWSELTRVSVPDADLPTLSLVESIDPGSESVPANLLRFSVTFSAEMEEGSAAGHIHLLDEAGTIIPGAFLDMPPELWDRGRRQLTILLEPGRLKRGLQPNLKVGAPLREGSAVTLVIDSGIRDARGAELVEDARRTYRVEAPIRSRIDPHEWDVRWPEPPRDALTIRFDRPLDRTLVRRYLRVLDPDGNPVPGRASLAQDARQWTFAPDAAVDLTLHVDARLEDLAGNSVRRVFDRDLDRAEDDGVDAAEVILTP
jgi:hypothetical protein